MFKPVSSHFNPALLEEQMLNFWKLRRTFAKAAQRNQGSAEFVFYERPPTASSRPTLRHAQARAFKDVFPRYKLMRGYHVVRRGGWDTHGLPVELGVEEQLGFDSQGQIEAYGLDRFNALCRKSAFAFIQEWERFSDRLGFWVDMQDAYVTYTNEYVESVWWILKTFWERGLLYQGYKVVPYCPRHGTPLSDHELALGYRETVDPSVYVRMPLVDEPGVSLLVWTTAPWTLPGNVAVAVHPDVEYVTIRRGLPEGSSERLILARPLLEKVFGDQPVAVVDSFKGRKLKGKRYKPLFTFLFPDKPAHYVILRDDVTLEAGTGLAHVAPAFGAGDLQAALDQDLPILTTVADDGTFIPEVRPWSGMFVKDADPYIIQDLEARGLLFRADTITHTRPFCWSCGAPLLDYAHTTWFIRTSQHRQRLVDLNQQIHWVPARLKNERFGGWLANDPDWAIGRTCCWGAPLPIWECASCHHQLAVGSIAELSQLAGRPLAGLDLHRPYVDEIHFPCPECRAQMGRVPEVIDAWFDAGSMPVAQWHFPGENRARFREQFPADFICEAGDQAYAWFYALHAISALLFNNLAFKNAICLGSLLDADGRELSEARGDLVDPWEALNTHGADAFRWYFYTASPSGQEQELRQSRDLHFSIDSVGEALHGFTLTLWNVYAFFVAHANRDRWQPPISQAGGETEASDEGNPPPLDRWLRSELHGLARDVTQSLEAYDVSAAARSIQAFVDDLSRWYLRRARRRFWKTGRAGDDAVDADRESAYRTLYEALVTLSKLLAPAMPFLSEALYQNLVRSFDALAPESVHLCDWPGFDPRAIDETLSADMRLVMQLAPLGHAARSQAGVKARQPLQEAAFGAPGKEARAALGRFADLLADELNVKRVRLLEAGEEEVEARLEPRPGLAVVSDGAYLAVLRTGLTPELVREGLAREFVYHVQEARQQAGFEIADRIRISLSATPELWEALREHLETIQGETLAVDLRQGQPPAGSVEAEAWFDGQWMKAGITRLEDAPEETLPLEDQG